MADLFNLDIASGQCMNTSIPQNVTFDEQGGVLDSAAPSARVRLGLGAPVVAALVAATLGAGFF